VRLAFSNGHDRVGDFHPLTRWRKQIQFRHAVFCRMPDEGHTPTSQQSWVLHAVSDLFRTDTQVIRILPTHSWLFLK
jgi:hypothetical protein